MMPGWLAHGLVVLVAPFVLTGVVQRVKALWSGRRGPPILQLLWDVRRLLRKAPVYSEVTTPVFRIAPWVFLVSALGSACIVPMSGVTPPVTFPLDFVWFAYVWGLGRMAIMLAALDTGSAFEGMGAAREAVFASLLEPVLFLAVGALCVQADVLSLNAALVHSGHGVASVVVGSMAVFALLVVLQVECGRLPVDDPQTHLELTMVHEVQVLDHSGADLAAIQVGAALKLSIAMAVLATLLNPWAGELSWRCVLAHLGLMLAVAVVVATLESTQARLRMRAVPYYIAAALVAGAIAVLATAWRPGMTR